jgi:hypothetical protein
MHSFALLDTLVILCHHIPGVPYSDAHIILRDPTTVSCQKKYYPWYMTHVVNYAMGETEMPL